jgi:hypothetical protein
VKNCIFCKVKLTNATKSKEHVFPVWLLEKLDFLGDMSSKNSTFPNKPEVIFNSRKIYSKSLVFGGVCKSCNNNWMSVLEQKVEPILFQILESEDTSLNREQCDILSKWVFKTIIILNAVSNYKQIIPQSHIDFFYKRLLIPNNVSIDITFCADSRLYYYIGGNKQFTTNENIITKKEMEESYVITFQVDYLLLRTTWSPNIEYQTLAFPENVVNRIFPCKNQNEIEKKVNNVINKDIEQFHFETTIFMDGLTQKQWFARSRS